MEASKPRNNETTNRIFLVDDFPLVRQGLRAVLDRETGLEVCGEAESVPEAFRQVRACRPELVVIDLSVKAGSGMDLIKLIKQFGTGIRMLVFSMHDELIYAERVMRSGAHGYVQMNASTAEFIHAVRKVLGGELYFSEAMTGRLLQRITGHTAIDQPLSDKLSDRELEVLQMIAYGNTTRRIAELLSLSIKTIETHRESLKRKLNLHSGAELTYWAIRRMNSASWVDKSMGGEGAHAD